MQNMKRLIAIAIVSIQILFSFPVIYAFADDSVGNIDESNAVICAIEYLRITQKEDIAWYKNNRDYTAIIADTLEYVFDNTNTFSDDLYKTLEDMIKKSADHVWTSGSQNVDFLSHYLYLSDLQNDYEINLLISEQTPDGGFGLAEGYTSDIIDTKLALKALADLGESEAMTKAAMYIASLDSEEGTYKVKAEIVRSSNEEKV